MVLAACSICLVYESWGENPWMDFSLFILIRELVVVIDWGNYFGQTEDVLKGGNKYRLEDFDSLTDLLGVDVAKKLQEQ